MTVSDPSGEGGNFEGWTFSENRILAILQVATLISVGHNIVLHKLVQCNVPHFIVKWTLSFLEGRQQRVKVNDGFSDWVQLVGGKGKGKGHQFV